MSRPHIEFIQAFEVAPELVEDGGLRGASRRLLSEDDTSGASTALVTLAAGWTGDLGAVDRPVEVFGLGGAITVGGVALGPGGYAYLAPTDVPRTVAVIRPAHLLVMVEAATSERGHGSVKVTDIATMRWQSSLAPGLSVKNLRLDPETGDRSWVSASCPRKSEHRAEVHPTVEECLMLRGDCLLGRHGEMSPGAYFWRPPWVEHGPLCTRNGAMYFFRSKGGDFDTTYAEVPGWEAMVDAYLGEDLIDVDLGADPALRA